MERSRFLNYLRKNAREITAALSIAAAASALAAPVETHAQNPFPERPSPSPTPILRPQTPPPSPVHQIDFHPFIPILGPKPEAVYQPPCHVKEPVSFYNLEGFPMANGQPMDPEASTAAIPLDEYLRHGERLGDYVEIYDPKTQAKEIVTITDRGWMASPQYGDKYLDVAQGVARRMGWEAKGVINLCYRLLRV